MPLPVTLPYVLADQTGTVPAADLDDNYNVLTAAINGINDGTNPLTNVSVTGGTWAGNPIAPAYGGTGQTTLATNGQLLIGNGSGFALSTLTAGSNIQIINSAGGISISATGFGTGSVTSVDIATGTTGLVTTGGPITTSGTITIGGTLAATAGGTGQNSYAKGDILYADSPTTVTRLGVGLENEVLTISNGLPAWMPSSGGQAYSWFIS